jgi:hypothetical protein
MASNRSQMVRKLSVESVSDKTNDAASLKLVVNVNQVIEVKNLTKRFNDVFRESHPLVPQGSSGRLQDFGRTVWSTLRF